MAKYLISKKWKKRTMTVLSAALCASLSLGFFAACAPENDEDEQQDEAVAKTDTQLIKNGDFEFYSEMTKELKDKRALLNSPTSWSFTSGSPSSDTKSGLVNVAQDEWDSLTKSSYSLISPEGTADSDAIAFGYTHWDEASIYDRLQFLDEYDDELDKLGSSSAEKKLFNKYNYSVDFEDVENLRAELGEKVALRNDDKTDTGVLMIHNSRTSDGVRGTAQYYTSGTTVTLKAGTSAELSVWVKTSNLYHYYSDNASEGDENNGTVVTRHAGAYIGVTNTVGGTTLDQMQIKNINTRGVEANNGWEEYKLYIRANTFATSTFRIVLGLGQGSSDNRYEAVDGYALFDDLTCKIITNEEYLTATENLNEENGCTVDDKGDDKKFDATEYKLAGKNFNTFALDLYAGFDAPQFDDNKTLSASEFALTKEVSGSNEYTSEKIDPKLADNRTGGAENERSVTGVYKFADLASLAGTNGYFKNIYENDFKSDSFPFAKDGGAKDGIVLLLSTNGAAYTAKLPEITVPANERMLFSFFVKTSKIMNGRSGAGATLIDGENKTSIAAFDSTTIDTVDIDNGKNAEGNKEDIYDGWVQCFFFVTNDTDDAKTFRVELTYGPTTIVGTDVFDYGQGYAAFANFESRMLSKTQVSYASTDSRAVKVTLTSSVADSSRFDGVSAASPEKIENGLANPASFTGVVSGSKFLVNGSDKENKIPEGVYAGLLNSEHASNYFDPEKANLTALAWNNKLNELAGAADDKWQAVFGDKDNEKKVARQPLVIMNTGAAATPSYGFFEEKQTIGASTYQRISMRVKLSANAKAYIYLIDTSDLSEYGKTISLNLPSVTYWYDDDGNITDGDPSKDESKVLFYLQENGLYKSADKADESYYANLHNYKELNGNLVTADETIAFYGKDGTYYAYKDYTQPVKNLPTTNARYTYTDKAALPGAAICVEGNAENADKWVEVSFYVHTGSESKSYRLEVWAGARDNETDGIPAGGYVFFDNYASATTSKYDDLLKLAKEEIRAELNEGKNAGDEGYVGKNDNLPADRALYYTFTFFDAETYLRYDVNEDEDEIGNRYASYKQSGYKEQIVYLSYNDVKGNMTGAPSCSFFLDYSAIDTAVTPDETGDTDTDTNEDETKDPISTGDILLIVSSGLLAVVLIAVIAMLIARHFWKKHPKKEKKAKPAKDKRVKAKKEQAPAEEKESEPLDADDPYNE